jgi:hypothetical protein
MAPRLSFHGLTMESMDPRFKPENDKQQLHEDDKQQAPQDDSNRRFGMTKTESLV